jgi:CSLREA domain-containing protein
VVVELKLSNAKALSLANWSFLLMRKRIFSSIVLSLLVLVISVSLASSANCTVTTADDHVDQTCNGDCSLREAVLEPTCSTIDFSLDLAGNPIVLTLGELAITHSVSITGWGADAITISGNNTSRIFYIATGANVQISGVTLRDGNGVGTAPNNGGAIRTLGGLTLDRVYFTGNDNLCASCYGTAVAFEGPTAGVIRNSTFSNNRATSWAVITSTASTPGVSIYNSTISDNSGTAIYLVWSNVKLVNTTVVNNGPVGVYIAGMANLQIGNSIVRDIYRFSMLGGISSDGNNIASTASGSNQVSYQPSDLVNVNPLLDSLRYNGGPTPTRAPLPGSPAIDAGNETLTINAGLTTDQRGFGRFADGGAGRAIVDIGPFELNGAAPAPVTVAGRVLGAVSGNPLRSQTVTIRDMLGNTRSALSSSLGWFVFDNLPAGFVYRVSVNARRGSVSKTVFGDHDLSDADILVPGL